MESKPAGKDPSRGDSVTDQQEKGKEEQAAASSEPSFYLPAEVKAAEPVRKQVNNLPREDQTTNNINKIINENRIINSEYSAKEWTLNGKMPCPICRSFKSAANFSRHTKTAHNIEPSRLFEEYRAEALAMLQERE